MRNKSLREAAGSKEAPKNTIVNIVYMAGLLWVIWWESCPDGEDLLAVNFHSRKKAEEYAEQKGWFISNES